MNPILQKLQSNGQQNGSMSALINALRTGNPNDLYQQMIRSNPQFAKFVRDNQGKTPQQIASAYGIDINNVLNRLGAQSRR